MDNVKASGNTVENTGGNTGGNVDGNTGGNTGGKPGGGAGSGVGRIGRAPRVGRGAVGVGALLSSLIGFAAWGSGSAAADTVKVAGTAKAAGTAKVAGAVVGWSAPRTLSAGGSGYRPSVVSDGAGDAVAVWLEVSKAGTRIQASRRPRGGSWGAPVSLSAPGALELSYPQLVGGRDGSAVAEWPDSDGVWTAELAPGATSGAASWSAPRLRLPLAAGTSTSPAIQLAGNSRGDVALVWQDGTVRAGTQSVKVISRAAGGAWSPATTAVTGAGVDLDTARLAQEGSLLVAYERYAATCTPRRCTTSAYRLHVTRFAPPTAGSGQAGGFGAGSDSGPLTAADSAAHAAVPVGDAAGRAGVLWTTPTAGVAWSRQATPTSGWSAATTIYTPQDPTNTATGLVDAQATPDGNVVAATGTGPAAGFDGSGQLTALIGDFRANGWSPTRLTTGTPPAAGAQLAVADTGAAAVTWTEQVGDTTAGHVKAAVRVNAASPFTSATTVGDTNGGDNGGIAIDDHARAHALWTTFTNDFTVSNVQASDHN